MTQIKIKSSANFLRVENSLNHSLNIYSIERLLWVNYIK